MMEIYWATLFLLRNSLRYLYIDPAVLHAPIYIIACNELLNRIGYPVEIEWNETLYYPGRKRTTIDVDFERHEN